MRMRLTIPQALSDKWADKERILNVIMKRIQLLAIFSRLSYYNYLYFYTRRSYYNIPGSLWVHVCHKILAMYESN